MSGERRPDTPAAIRAVALELFATHGFDATSLREIADRLGLTKAALYYHYPSKTELIRAVLQPLTGDVTGLLDELEAAPAPTPREILGRWFDVIDRHQLIFAALLRDASGFAHIDLEAWAGELVERLLRLLVAPGAGVEDEVRAVVAISGLSRAPMLVALDDRARVRDIAVAAACAAMGVDPNLTLTR